MDIKNAPNRHYGASSKDCPCGLVHDDEMNEHRALRRDIIEALGSKCSNKDCRWLNIDGVLGCKDIEALQIHHVFDDGFMERKKYMHCEYLRNILKHALSGKYELLCANCHAIKTRNSWQGRMKGHITRSIFNDTIRLSRNDAMGKVRL